MGHLCFLILTAIACSSQATWAAERIAIGDDGSVEAPSGFRNSGPGPMVLDFGLPKVTALRRWRDNGALRSEWMTNGIRYTQTMLVAAVQREVGGVQTDIPAVPVLLVNIEGEN